MYGNTQKLDSILTKYEKRLTMITTIYQAPLSWFTRYAWSQPDGLIHCESNGDLYLLQPLAVWYVGKLPPDYNSTQLELI